MDRFFGRVRAEYAELATTGKRPHAKCGLGLLHSSPCGCNTTEACLGGSGAGFSSMLSDEEAPLGRAEAGQQVTSSGSISGSEPQPGLLSRLASAGRGRAAAVGPAAAPQDADLEQPLLPATSSGRQQLEVEEAYVEHVMESSPKRWPQLRLSSVSARRLSPAVLGGSGEGVLEGLLSPRASSHAFASFTAATQAAPVAGTPHPFHTTLLDQQQQAAHKAAPPSPPPPEQPEAGRFSRAAVTGAINAVIALPIMGAFASIIFRVSAETA